MRSESANEHAASAAPGTDYVTVIHLRTSDGPAVVATLVQQTKDKITLKIAAGKHTDLITLTPKGGSFRRYNAATIVLPITMPDRAEPGCTFHQFDFPPKP